ncbi:hypothetical protein A2U01_0040298 [Trifolium medium]|uniref:Uncharacterized protein n=1 Tax=Trifolium medium TaxID=97028 RepID=A0A392Q410_9FABA|nr:hypothetical protein [Trifolium medium]
MAPGTQTARETATTETTETEDEDGIHRTHVPVTMEAAWTTPTKTSEEGSPTVIPLLECWLFDRGKTPGKHTFDRGFGRSGHTRNAPRRKLFAKGFTPVKFARGMCRTAKNAGA